MMQRAAVVSSPPMAASTCSVLEALGITSKTSSANHHTMMSSTTEPSSSSRRWVYWARPGPDLARGRWTGPPAAGRSAGPFDPHRAEMADVEDDRVVSAGPVLGQGARRVGQRHLPSPNSTSFAPSRRWASMRAVWRSALRPPRRRSDRRATVEGVGHGDEDTGAHVQAVRAMPACRGAVAGQPVLGQEGQGVALVEQGHPHVGVELAQPADLAVLLRDQSLVERGRARRTARARAARSRDGSPPSDGRRRPTPGRTRPARTPTARRRSRGSGRTGARTRGRSTRPAWNGPASPPDEVRHARRPRLDAR